MGLQAIFFYLGVGSPGDIPRKLQVGKARGRGPGVKERSCSCLEYNLEFGHQ